MLAIFDIPKSDTLALLPEDIKTLLLERSRWMIPLKWRYARARAMSWQMFTWVC